MMALTVQQLYQQYAGRPADPGGVDYFSRLFGSEIDPSEVARFQTAIAEARAQGSEQAAAAPTTLSVNDLYRQYAGRAADPGGVDYFSRLFGPEIDTNEAARFQTAIAEARLQGSEPATAAQIAAARPVAAAGAADIANRQNAINAQIARERAAAQQALNAAAGQSRPGSLAIEGQSNLPFEYATQGFADQLANYRSIPIGAQYNPGAVGGVGSPYSQIMSQMRSVGNPYATVQSGVAMGGYNPNVYDPNLLSNFIAERAAEREAQMSPQAAADMGGFDGGLITKVMGPKPPTPDDGTMFVQKGEYIVKKDSVNKYGKSLLDKINDGKIPASKMKSLLG
jgi:hypothetical protein